MSCKGLPLLNAWHALQSTAHAFLHALCLRQWQHRRQLQCKTYAMLSAAYSACTPGYTSIAQVDWSTTPTVRKQCCCGVFRGYSCSVYLHRSSCCIHGIHGVESMCAMHCAWLAGLILTHATAGRWPCCHHAHTTLYQLGILLPVTRAACMSARLSALVEPATAAATAADAYDHL